MILVTCTISISSRNNMKHHDISWHVNTYHGGHSGDSLLRSTPTAGRQSLCRGVPHGVPWGPMGMCRDSLGEAVADKTAGICWLSLESIRGYFGDIWWYATSIHMLFTMVFTMLFTMVNTMVHRSAYTPFHVHCRLIWWHPRGVQLGRRRQHFERTKEDPNAEDPAMISTCTVRVPLFRSCECDCDILWPCQPMSNYVKSCQVLPIYVKLSHRFTDFYWDMDICGKFGWEMRIISSCVSRISLSLSQDF